MKTVYVIQEHNWQYNDNWHARTIEEPVVAYSDRELAEIRCDELSQQYWAGDGRNPFWMARISPTSLDEPELVRQLAEFGVEPPPVRDTPRGWATLDWENRIWWQTLHKYLVDHPSLKIWKLFDRLYYFEVVAVEVGPDDLEAA